VVLLRQGDCVITPSPLALISTHIFDFTVDLLLLTFPLPLRERIKVRGTTVAVETAPHPHLLPRGEKKLVGRD